MYTYIIYTKVLKLYTEAFTNRDALSCCNSRDFGFLISTRLTLNLITVRLLSISLFIDEHRL